MRGRHQRQQQRSNQEYRENLDRRDVEQVSVVPGGNADALGRRWAVADSMRQVIDAAIDQVITDVRLAQVDARVLDGPVLRHPCKAQRLARNLNLGQVRVTGEQRYALAIRFAAVEIHAAIRTSRVFAQHAVKGDQGLGDDRPVSIAKLAQAFDRGLDHGVQPGRDASCQHRFALGDRLLHQVELHQRRERPKLLKLQRLLRLGCFHVDGQRLRVPHVAGSAKVACRDRGDARQSRSVCLVCWRQARQAIQNAPSADNLVDRGAEQARVLAKHQQRIGRAGLAVRFGQGVQLAHQRVERRAGGRGPRPQPTWPRWIPGGMPDGSIAACLLA